MYLTSNLLKLIKSYDSNRSKAIMPIAIANPSTYLPVGEWGLPSIDFECLQVLCAIKFIETPVEINFHGNPFLSGSGKLPYLKDEQENKKIVGANRIIDYLKTKGYSINSRLTKDIQFLSDAYNSLLFNNLHPYFYYIMFGDPQNMEKTRTLYAKRTPFPFNFYYPGKIVKLTDDIVQVFCGFSIYFKKDEHDIEQMILNAKQCVNMLSQKLGNKKWFFDNNRPSEFDANVYAYLSILYHIQLPTNPLQSHIRECTNLLKFLNRITRTYFSSDEFLLNSNYDKKKSTTSNSNANDSSTILTQSERDFLESKTRTQILAFLGAFIAMSTYAAWIGLFKISVGGQYDEDFLYEDEDDNNSEN